MLRVGDPIPDFALASDSAGEVKASDLRGKRFVLYFYPRDDTPGCTVEACSFRDNLPNFSSLKIPVFGISADDVDSHTRFRDKFNLTFPLLADPDHHIAEAFGTWVEKNNYGRKYMGIQRSTFVIDPNGRIEHVWEKVTPAEHVQQVLDYLQAPSSAVEQPAADSSPATTPASAPEPNAASKTAKTAASKKTVMKKTSAKKAVQKVAAKKTSAKKAVSKKATRR